MSDISDYTPPILQKPVSKVPSRHSSLIASKLTPSSSLPRLSEDSNEINLKDLKYPYQAIGWKKVIEAQDQLDSIANIMDEKMNVALVKTEKEFLMGYNMYGEGGKGDLVLLFRCRLLLHS